MGEIGRPRKGPARRLLCAVVAMALVEVVGGVGAPDAFAQEPVVVRGEQDPVSIAEYHRLIETREAEIERLQERLAFLEARRDSLLTRKSRAEEGSDLFEILSNEIRENANRIRPVQRDLRILLRDVKSLKTSLFLRYNAEIGRLNQRIEELRNRGATPGTNPELRRLVDLLPEYLAERLRLEGEIEQAETDLILPELVYLPTDGPNELRWKEAAARDAVDKIDARLAAIDEQIDNEIQRKRIREEAQRLRRDLELWGDDQSVRRGGELEQLLEQPDPSPGVGGGTDPFIDPDERIRELQQRRLELIDRRTEYVEKAARFARRLREFYR